jgi:hypothetical protein
MEQIIKKYETQEQEQSIPLVSKDKALEIFDLLVEGNNIIKVKYETFTSVEQVKKLNGKFVEIRDMMERIVKHQAWLKRPVLDEQGNVIEEGELCPVPQSEAKLIERSLQLINNDYDFGAEPLFDVQSVEEVQDAVEYIVHTIITHSNLTNDADYDWWKSKVTE